jgi:nucleoside-diphosphate-sugar epimerase
LVENLCEGVHTLYHLASKVSWGIRADKKSMHQVNVTGTINIFDAALKQGVPFFV